MTVPPQKFLVDYLRSFEAARLGMSFQDKFAILFNRVLHGTFLLSTVWFKLSGRSLINPSRLVNGYRCQYGNLVFYCPGGNAETQFLSQREPEIKRMISTIHRGDAIDVGANLGLYTITLSNSIGTRGRVVSIEPDPIYFAWLKRNVEGNHCKNVVPLNMALWSTSTKLALSRHIFGGPGLDSSVSVRERSGYEVTSDTLDEIVARFSLRPSFVKIDSEGAEYQILRGMPKTLYTYRPVLIVEALDGLSLFRCKRFLEAMRYQVMMLDESNFVARPRKDSETLEWFEKIR